MKPATIKDTQILEAIDKINSRNPASVAEAASAIVESFGDGFNSGDKVIVIDDPTYPYSGQRGTVRALESNGAYCVVEFENGTSLRIMSNQLLRG